MLKPIAINNSDYNSVGGNNGGGLKTVKSHSVLPMAKN
jgi:hypothetical protein